MISSTDLHPGLHPTSTAFDRLLALREEIGDFGELVYAGMDWVDPALGKRSMQLMAEEERRFWKGFDGAQCCGTMDGCPLAKTETSVRAERAG